MTDRTANQIGIGFSVLVFAGILLGSVASLLGAVALCIQAVSLARPDILPASTARKGARFTLVLAVVLFVAEMVAVAILKSKGVL